MSSMKMVAGRMTALTTGTMRVVKTCWPGMPSLLARSLFPLLHSKPILAEELRLQLRVPLEATRG